MGPSAPSETVAAGGVAAEAKEEGAPAVPAGAAPLEGGEAAAAAVAAQGSLWNQGVTPLRSLMETMISEGPPGAPQLQRAAASFTSRSRAPSLTKPKDAYQGKYFGTNWLGLLLPPERLPPLYSLDENAINYHLLPLSLLHKFRGAPAAPPVDEAPLPQTPPPERVRGPSVAPVDKKKPAKKGGNKKKKKKTRGAKGAPKKAPPVGPPPSSLLPTIENYWGRPDWWPSQETLPGAPLKPTTSVMGPNSEKDRAEYLRCVEGVGCLEGDGAPWLTDRQLGALIMRVGGGLRCLSLRKNHVGEEAGKALAICTNLEYLDLSSCEEIMDLSFLKEMRWLRGINLSGCIRAVNEENVGCLLHLKWLEELQIARCPDFSDDCLSRFSSCFPQLLSFNCSGCDGVTTQGLQVFFSNHPELLNLNISFCCRTESDAKLSACLGLLPDLQEIDCSGCDTVSNGVLLRLSESCKGLRGLRLAGASSLRDEGLALLARLNCFKHLSLLDVRGCTELSAMSIEVVLRGAPSLSFVYLDGVNKISDDQLKQIKSKYPSCTFVRRSETEKNARGMPLYRKISTPEKKKKKPPPQ